MEKIVNQITFKTLQREWEWFLDRTNGGKQTKIDNQRFGQYLMNKYVGVPEVFYIEDASEVYSLVYDKLANDEANEP